MGFSPFRLWYKIKTKPRYAVFCNGCLPRVAFSHRPFFIMGAVPSVENIISWLFVFCQEIKLKRRGFFQKIKTCKTRAIIGQKPLYARLILLIRCVFLFSLTKVSIEAPLSFYGKKPPRKSAAGKSKILFRYIVRNDEPHRARLGKSAGDAAAITDYICSVEHLERSCVFGADRIILRLAAV